VFFIRINICLDDSKSNLFRSKIYYSTFDKFGLNKLKEDLAFKIS